ncbi:MAG: DMT family transporter [Alphaproteobacteria bacterium]|nr:MAG: DMT family transporter [Alphaproteobacteria bacterium]
MPDSLPGDATPALGAPTSRATLAGVPFIVASAVVFALLWALIRYASRELHPLQMVFYRQLVGMLAVLPLLRHGGLRLLRTHRLGGHMVRAFAGVTAAYLTFFAIALIPLADAVAVSYAAPLFTSLAAVAILREKLRVRRLVAVAVGFLGMLLVLRPGLGTMSWGHAVALAAAVFVAVSMISIRQLTSTEHPRTIVFYNFCLALPISFVAVLPIWHWPSAWQLAMLVAIGLGSFLGQMLLVRAFALSEASALMPFDFLRLVLAAALGFALFGERVDGFTLAGAFVILATTVYIAHRERAERRRPKSLAKPL